MNVGLGPLPIRIIRVISHLYQNYEPLSAYYPSPQPLSWSIPSSIVAALLQTPTEGGAIAFESDSMAGYNCRRLYMADVNQLRTDSFANAAWQWDNNPLSVLSALQAHGGAGGDALAWLKSGQSHNPPVQDLYSVAQSDLGEEFWRIVATASYHTADFAEARANLDWQYSNSLASLSNALDSWQGGNFYGAVAFVCDGQRHNPNVMAEYRACIAADEKAFFGMIDQILGH
jgi:hypothetical protein